jgi:hypothetical protein
VPTTLAEICLDRPHLLAERGLLELIGRGCVESVGSFVAAHASSAESGLQVLAASDVARVATVTDVRDGHFGVGYRVPKPGLSQCLRGSCRPCPVVAFLRFPFASSTT